MDENQKIPTESHYEYNIDKGNNSHFSEVKNISLSPEQQDLIIIKNEITLHDVPTSEIEELNKNYLIPRENFQNELQEHQNSITKYNTNQAKNNISDSDTHYKANMVNIRGGGDELEDTSNYISNTGDYNLNQIDSSIDSKVKQSLEDITILKKQVRFATRGEGKESREVKRHIIDWLNKAKNRILKYNKAIKKFGGNVVQDDHEAVMFAKINTLLASSKNYISQGITGDLDEAKGFFPDNIFDDGNPYIPDKLPSQSTFEKQNNPKWIKNLSPEQQQLYMQCVRKENNPNINKELGKLTDTKMVPRLVNSGMNPQGARLFGGAAKLGILVVNGITLWNAGKSIFGLIFGAKNKDGSEKSKGKLFSNFLVNAGIFTGLNYIDPDKALGKIKETRNWVSGDSTKGSILGGNNNGYSDLSSSLLVMDSKETTKVQQQAHGSLIMGHSLGGLNYQEAAQNNIFQSQGNTITGVNISNLKEFYNSKFADQTETRNEYITYANTLQELQNKHPNIIGDITKEQYITASTLQDPEHKDTIIGTHIVKNLNEAKGAINSIQDFVMIDNIVKKSQPNIVDHIGGENYNRLIDGIKTLPNKTQKEIIDGKIEFKSENNIIFIKSQEEIIGLNPDTNTILIRNRSGEFVEFPDGASNMAEALQLSILLTGRISEHKYKFNIRYPWKYKDGGISMAKKIFAQTGESVWHDPNSYIEGQTVTMLNAFPGSSDKLIKFKDPSLLGRFTYYLNDLDIWVGKSVQGNIGSNQKNKPSSTIQENNTTALETNISIPDINTDKIWTGIGSGITNIVKRVRDTGNNAGEKLRNGLTK